MSFHFDPPSSDPPTIPIRPAGVYATSIPSTGRPSARCIA